MADISWIVTNQIPQWFYVLTSIIQGLGILVSFMISYLGFKAYKLTEEKKYKYFFYGFLFMGLSFLANLVLNIVIRSGYAGYFLEKRYELAVAPVFAVYYFFLIGLLFAYLSLAIVYSNMKTSKRIWLMFVWAFIVGAYTFRESLLFNMFAAILLSFVVFETYEKYKENKKIQSRLFTFISFVSLFIFHLSILLDQSNAIIGIGRYIVLLFGLSLLLSTLIKIFYGRTKK